MTVDAWSCCRPAPARSPSSCSGSAVTARMPTSSPGTSWPKKTKTATRSRSMTHARSEASRSFRPDPSAKPRTSAMAQGHRRRPPPQIKSFAPTPGGNLPPCKRGFVRRHGDCVRRTRNPAARAPTTSPEGHRGSRHRLATRDDIDQQCDVRDGVALAVTLAVRSPGPPRPVEAIESFRTGAIETTSNPLPEGLGEVVAEGFAQGRPAAKNSRSKAAKVR